MVFTVLGAVAELERSLDHGAAEGRAMQMPARGLRRVACPKTLAEVAL